jgi:hypothetical protein
MPVLSLPKRPAIHLMFAGMARSYKTSALFKTCPDNL